MDIYEGTGEGFIEWVWGVNEPYIAHSHQMTNILIKVDGDTAVSETYLRAALHAQPTKNSANTSVVRDRYADKWSKRDGRLAIDHRLFTLDFTTADASTGPSRPGTSRRDRTDPSYRVYPN